MPQKHKVRHAGSLTPKLCGGKRCYSTKKDAETVKHEQEILTPGLELSIYHCVTCGNWHLTRQMHSYGGENYGRY